MFRFPIILRANAIAFTSSFCVMMIELIAIKISVPHTKTPPDSVYHLSRDKTA